MLKNIFLNKVVRIIFKFLITNFLAFFIPALIIWYIVKDDHASVSGIAAAFLLPLFIPSLIYLIYSTFKLFKHIKLKYPHSPLITIISAIIEFGLYSVVLAGLSGLIRLFFMHKPIDKLFDYFHNNFNVFTVAIISLGVVYRYLKARKKNSK